MQVQVKNQAELDKALADGNYPVLVGSELFVIKGSARVVARESARVEAWGSARVVARESARVVARESARVEAWGSARVVARESARVVARESARVEAWGSARVEAWGSARVVARESAIVVARESAIVVARESASVEAWESASVEAWGSASVDAWGSARVVARESASVEAWGSASVEAWGSARVVARESASVEASQYVAVQRHGARAAVKGGVQIQIPSIDSPEAWCAYYGVPIAADGTVIVYKALDENFRSGWNFVYRPGTSPEAPDWDGGEEECGGGLHFAPHPAIALTYFCEASRFAACPVNLADFRTPRPDDVYQNKIKARRVCGPIVECDRDGNPIAPPAAPTATANP